MEKTTPDTYLTYETSLSTVGATDWSTKVIIIHYTVKPGMGALASDTIKAWKAVYAKLGLNVGVWHTAYSGESAYTLSYRLKSGWKDLDANTPTMRKTLEELAGPNEWARLQQNAAAAYEKVSSEMVEFKPELSSK